MTKWMAAHSVAGAQLKAIGGTVTYSGGYTIHTFTATGTLTARVPLTCEVLVVAGGGGGGYDGGGGGGGGGVVKSFGFSLAAASHTATVGNGGARATTTAANAANGENSAFSTVTATGGGGGGSKGLAGSNGSSGGGGGHAATSGGTHAGGTGTSGQGSNGGASGNNIRGGGGGGAGAVGSTGGTASTGGNGGNGISIDISGTTTFYGGGGGGGTHYQSYTGGSGGQGGGGKGGDGGTAALANRAGVDGTANTGGGGGGVGNLGGSPTAGNGGSGIVIVRYLTANGKLPPWTPSVLGSAIKVWLDADDATTFTYSSGALVSQWRDKSGGSRHANMATTARQPSRVENIRNGRAVIRFVDDRMLFRTGLTAVPYTYFVVNVFSRGDTGLTQRLLHGQSDATGENGDLSILGTPAYSLYSGVTDLRRGTPDANWHVLYAVGNGSTSSIWRDGAQMGGTGSIGSGYPDQAHIGSIYWDGQYMEGDIGEIIVTQGIPSTEDRQKMEGYLAHKWGLAGNLPSNHPYKNSAP